MIRQIIEIHLWILLVIQLNFDIYDYKRQTISNGICLHRCNVSLAVVAIQCGENTRYRRIIQQTAILERNFARRNRACIIEMQCCQFNETRLSHCRWRPRTCDAIDSINPRGVLLGGNFIRFTASINLETWPDGFESCNIILYTDGVDLPINFANVSRSAEESVRPNDS